MTDKPVHDGWTLRTDKRNTVKRKQHFRAVTKTAHKAFTSTNLQTSMQSTKIEWYLLNYWTSMYSRIHRAIETKNSPVRDWRSTPTYCQLQSHLTQKLGQKSKIRGHLPAPMINGEEKAFEIGRISLLGWRWQPCWPVIVQVHWTATAGWHLANL